MAPIPSPPSPGLASSLKMEDTNGHLNGSRCQVSAASGLNAVEFKAMRPGSFQDKMCAFNHVPRNSIGCADPPAVPQRQQGSSPRVLAPWGSFPPQSIRGLCSEEEELQPPFPRATKQERTELPLQSTCLYQWNLKAQVNLSQSTGSPLTPSLPGSSPPSTATMC